MRRICFLLVGSCLALATVRPPAVQTSAGPGAIALLAARDDHTIDGELRQALLDPDPRTRLLAGRVIGVIPHRDLLNELIGALAREQDRAVGAELVRDALYAGGDQALPIVGPQVKRLGFPAAAAAAEWTGRMHPDRFIESLPALADSIGPAAWRLPPLIDMIAAQHPDKRSGVFSAWMAVAPARGWGDLLDLAYGSPASVESAAATIEAALASARPSVREESVWFLVNALADKRPVPANLLDAALAREPADASEWEQFGRQLLARRRKKARAIDATELINREGTQRNLRRALADLSELSRSERDAVVHLSEVRPGSSTLAWRSGAAAIRTVALPVEGGVAATLTAAGCQPDADKLGAAELSYSPDGRTRSTKVGGIGLSSSCLTALSALARLSVAQPGYPVSEASQVVVLPLHSTFLQCAGRVNIDGDDDGRGRPAFVAPPHKVRDVKPFYPQDAQSQRIQGVVVVAASVTDRGCIASARVSRSIPYLDLAALWAVTQWLFDPPLIDGKVSPMEMTVTVNFQLR